MLFAGGGLKDKSGGQAKICYKEKSRKINLAACRKDRPFFFGKKLNNY
jgi:hypothetical protein